MRPRVCGFFHKKAAESRASRTVQKPTGCSHMGNANLSGDAPWSVFFLALAKDFWRASGVESRTI